MFYSTYFGIMLMNLSIFGFTAILIMNSLCNIYLQAAPLAADVPLPFSNAASIPYSVQKVQLSPPSSALDGDGTSSQQNGAVAINWTPIVERPPSARLDTADYNGDSGGNSSGRATNLTTIVLDVLQRKPFSEQLIAEKVERIGKMLNDSIQAQERDLAEGAKQLEDLAQSAAMATSSSASFQRSVGFGVVANLLFVFMAFRQKRCFFNFCL